MTQTTIDHAPEQPSPQRRAAGFGTVWGIAFVVAVSLAAFTTLVDVSTPGGHFLAEMVLLLVWPVLGLLWGIWALVLLVRAITTRSFDRRSWLWLVVSALIVAVTAGLVVIDAPLKARFAVSASALTERAELELTLPEAYVDDSEPPAPDGLPSCVRLFCFDSIERDGDDVFFTRYAGFFDQAGLVYSPDGPPSVEDGGYTWEFEALGDGWYSFYANE